MLWNCLAISGSFVVCNDSAFRCRLLTVNGGAAFADFNGFSSLHKKKIDDVLLCFCWGDVISMKCQKMPETSLNGQQRSTEAMRLNL